jgi:Tropinone reductase 1
MQFASRWRLDGQCALVTGGTKGIGKASVEEMCMLGARVFTCARDGRVLEACLAEWRAKGFSVAGMVADLSQKDEVGRLVSACSEHFGGTLHILFANAGTNIRKRTEDYTAKDYDTIMQLNMHNTYWLVQQCYPLLLQGVARSNKHAPHTTPVASIVINSSVGGVTALDSGGLRIRIISRSLTQALTNSHRDAQVYTR